MVARPLVLKTQVGTRSKNGVLASELPVARVWVDTGVYHLDSLFDYSVLESQSLLGQVGVRVEVPFGNSLREGIIVSRIPETASTSGLKELSKILSPHPVATSQSLELLDAASKRWASNPYDILRSAIPPRVQSVDRTYVPGVARTDSLAMFTPSNVPGHLQQKSVRTFWSLPPDHHFDELIANLIRTRSRYGQVLVIVPDESTLISIFADVTSTFPELKCVRIDGHTLRSERYLGYLKAINHDVDVIFGLRGAIFTPLLSDSTIVIVGESSHLLYEARSPGWNARDVAILRARKHNANLVLVGYSPSLEVSREIDLSFLSLVSSKRRRPVRVFDSPRGELLPTGIFAPIRKALKEGPVLFLVPTKGYGNAVLCAKCRNIALCSCGGKLQRKAAHQPPECAVCGSRYMDWRCTWCQSSAIYLASRGIDRFAEEIGRSFPTIPIVNSSGDHIIRTVDSEKLCVIATPGAAPRAAHGFSAVVLLQGFRFFGHSDLRSFERAKDLFFDISARASSTGEVYVVIEPSHPIVAALNTWDPSVMARRELQELSDAKLPPYWRVVILEQLSHEASALFTGLEKARVENRLPEETKILGPFVSDSGKSRITLACPEAHANEMIDFIHELQRKRSISHKPLYSLRVDPYSLG